MLSRKTKLYSVIFQKCPQCHEGDMFKHAPYSTKFAEMNKNCPVCGFDFIQEPNFYFGAMYFSYAFQVVIFVAVYLILRFTTDPGPDTYIIVMTIAVIVALPINFRWSRVAWINLFASYKERVN